jgi:hypothetical protein
MTKQTEHISQLRDKGDYCLVFGGDMKTPDVYRPKNVVLACPVCGQLMVCYHTIVSVNPLTLMPSVVGPHNSQQALNCGHHFFIEKGEVKL